MQRVIHHSAPGKAREMRALVEARAKIVQARGVRAGVSVPVFARESGTVIQSTAFDDLAALEKQRQHNAGDKDFQEYLGKVGAISSASASVELYEVVVELPPRKP